MNNQTAVAASPDRGSVLDTIARVLSRIIGVPGVVDQFFGDQNPGEPGYRRQAGSVDVSRVRQSASRLA